MRKLLVMFVVILGLFCFCSVTMAEGFTVFGDYTFTSMDQDQWDNDIDALAIGAEYDMDPILVGGSYVVGIGFDPEPSAGVEETMSLWGIYGGYSLMSDDAFNIAMIGGYYSWKWETSGGGDYVNMAATSIALGVKGSADFGPINASILYLLGVSNSFEGDIFIAGLVDPAEQYESADPGFSLLELKGTYQLGDNLGVYLVYRVISVTDFDDEYGTSGFGLGIQAKF